MSLTTGCESGPLGCNRETGVVFENADTLPATARASYEVTSPRNSNLIMTLTWENGAVEPQMTATIIDCGGHTGCQMLSQGSRRTGPTAREMQVDGWRGKRYRIDVEGDLALDQRVTLRVRYDTGGCT